AHQQLEKEIVALWQEGAVITKAAQSLYIHRNTLQYRLDKWFDWTGLQLKELTDLAVCYMVIMDLSI
ncbi:PucR family transcriptional regulator, partial [Streptococcus suis]